MVHTTTLKKGILFSMKSFLRASNTVNAFVSLSVILQINTHCGIFSFLSLICVSRELPHPTGGSSSDNLLY